jgi:hypothetical protein
VAKARAAALARVQAHLLDLAAPLEEVDDHLLVDFTRQATDPDRATIRRPAVRHGRSLVFPRPVCFDRLVWSMVHAHWHALQQRARQLNGRIHRVGLKEFDVAKVAVA